MINDKQFLIGDKPTSLSGWNNITLVNNKILSYQPKLNVLINDEHSVVILGYAWNVLPDVKTPEDAIREWNSETTRNEIFETENYWCGRYVLVVGNALYLDTSGSLGVFYGGTDISSSMNVICQHQNKKIVIPNIQHRVDPDYVPGGKTMNQGINRLLPSQVLDIVTCSVENRPLLPSGIITENSIESQIDRLAESYVYSLKNMANHFKGYTIQLALTGGRDSRAVLALIERSGVKYETFTAEHDNLQDGDRYIPKKLAKILNRPYRFIRRNKKLWSQQKYDDYHQHTSGYAVDEDWLFYSYGQYQQLNRSKTEKTLILRSAIWEIPNSYLRKYYDGKCFDLYKIYPGMLLNPILKESGDKWLKMVNNDKFNNEISKINRLMWEFRNGCWTSSIEQSFDMMDNIESIQTCNNRYFLSILLGFDAELSHKKKHEELLVSRVCPQIGNIIYDDQGTSAPYWICKKRNLEKSYNQIKRKVKKCIKRIIF